MSSPIAHNAMHRWHEQVEAAASCPAILATVQDFLVSLKASDVERLPPDCRPGAIHEASDIDAWNLRLAEAVKALWGTDQDLEVLTEVAQLFLRASVKLSRLAGADSHPLQ